MRHRFRTVPAPLALLLACLTHVTTSLAGIPPIEIRLAVARAERGDSKALDTLTAYTPSDEDSALQASIGRVQVLALLDRVDALGEIAQSGDGDVARRARLELAKLHLRKNAGCGNRALYCQDLCGAVGAYRLLGPL